VLALQWHGRRDLRLVDVAEPAPPGAGEVLIDIEWCGICGTDIEEYTDGPVVIPTTPHPLTGLCAPITIGHEAVGRVAARGPGAGLAVGTLVAVDGYVYCGQCFWCRRNEVTRCERWGHVGMSYPGGLAERLLVQERMALPAPDGVPAERLALAEPFSIAVRAVRRGRIGLGDRVAVVGGGTIGLAVLQVALAGGCADTVLVEPLAARRELAARFGAGGAVADIAGLVGAGLGGSFDVVVDCTGAAGVPGAALSLARSGGRVVLVGIPVRPGEVDFAEIVLRELTVIGTVGHVYDEDTRIAVALIAGGRVDPDPLVTHRLTLDRAIADGIELLAGEGRATALKVLVSPKALPDPAGGGDR
jgi:(R,R)-butanediol dehydrogenase / meso-butanediol dehydrogenase / diacetyl reductase